MTPEDKIKNVLGTTAMNYLPYFLILLVLTLFLFYLGDKLTLNERNCTTLSNLYTSYPRIKSIDYDSDEFDYRLRDFYIKSAYNCCCAGGFKNDYVNVCALENVLKNGARFLDFEIYAKDDMPIIGASSTNEYSYKETYNDLAFKTAMEKINDVAFSSICPNPEDPIILHFRIKSEKGSICDVMAKDINHTFGQDHLDKLYSYEYRGNNLGDVKLKDLKKKVIVIVDKSENLKFKSTKLYEFVNMCSGSTLLRKYRNNDIEHNIDTDEIVTHNKMKMSIVLPDVNTKIDNYSYIHAKEAGIQIMAMNFQNFDSNLKFYSLFFDSAGYAFVLKPEDRRSTTIEVETPESSVTLPTTTSYGCPATQEACPDLNNTTSDIGTTPTDNTVTPADSENLNEKETGKWDRDMKLKDIRKSHRRKLYQNIIDGKIYNWAAAEEGRILTDEGDNKYWVGKCKHFDGIPGVNFYDQGVWANVYGDSSREQNDKLNSWTKEEASNESVVKTLGEQYCNNAIYRNAEGDFKTCGFKEATVKGNPYGNKGGTKKNNSKKTIEGAFNIVWKDNKKEENINKYPFWKVKCIENP
jgi:hypothetical protein